MPKNVTIWAQLDTDKAVQITLTVVERGTGNLDPDRERQPTITEMEEITGVLNRRDWTFNKPI
ncbi:hypothetical protein [Luteolibacter sp. LG18]|uniref:hypothetical protein n=1 Tax=Luteolibacter sp. LG18 TaxID=2819286 RepID=UPI002B313757|nr:hypothetical protein llg_07050 [Luteolibacter sp. LG18]BCU79666.1 hypothetical protein llg_43810 [Luteolibacter sp. LG18]